MIQLRKKMLYNKPILVSFKNLKTPNERCAKSRVKVSELC